MDACTTYQLFIHLRRPCRIAPGRLGVHRLAAGWYVYTGSARRNLRARVCRHLRASKTRRWHVDWLLERAEARIHWLRLAEDDECHLTQTTGGGIPIPGFGASDCRSGCGSHLRYLGSDRPAPVPADAAERRRVLQPYRSRGG